MKLDRDTIEHVAEESRSISKLVDDPNPAELSNAESRLAEILYEFETLTSYADSFPKEGVKDIAQPAEELRARLARRLVEAPDDPASLSEFLLDGVSRLDTTIAKLGYFLR